MTSLQKQLAAIAATSTHQLDLKAQRTAHGKSLLFESKVAASQSFDYIYSICYDGYRDLCALDHRFAPFARTLFSEQSKAEDRTQMTRKENEELDQVLESFITLVGPRLLLKPAEKALEWLVRRFRVHEYNTECLVWTYLPYHATPQFLALLSILPSNPPTTLRFLFPYITPPTNPPRQTLVYTAVNTPAFFAAFQGHMLRVFQAGHHGSSLLSFWASITAQAVDGILEQSQSGRKDIQEQRTEQLLLRILPALNQCLQLSNIPEALLGCYMIVIVMVTKSNLDDKVLDALMEAVVRSQEPDTLDGCLMCLAVIAEERSHITLPSVVVKRLLNVKDVVGFLQRLSDRCRVERLALGCALGALDNINRLVRIEENRTAFEAILGSSVCGEAYTSVSISTLLQLIRKSTPASAEQGQLIDLANQLGESSKLSEVLRSVAGTESANLEALGLLFQNTLEIDYSGESADSDEEMLNADADLPDIHGGRFEMLSEIEEPTFLDTEASATFADMLGVFESIVSSKSRVEPFLGSPALRRQDASENPLFLSFLIRSWCSSASAPVRIAAIRSASAAIDEFKPDTDLQMLVPYLIHALGDPSAAVRRSAASCVATLSSKAKQSDAHPKHHVWGASNLYGSSSSKVVSLSKGQTSSLVSAVLVPVLEECVVDPNFITTAVRSVFDGTQPSKSHPGHSLKSTVRSSFITFLASHVALAPLLNVRLRLLPLFNATGKLTASARSKTILPIVRRWCSLTSTSASTTCGEEKVNIEDADREHLAALLPREPGSVQLLKDLISGDISTDRQMLLNTTFDRLISIWKSFKAESRLLLSRCLLDCALQDSSATQEEDIRRLRSSESLRTVKLDTAELIDFIESVPAALQMPEGPPTKKRRRTSRSEMARVEMQSTENVSKLLRKLTFVLELIESSHPGEHPALFKNLFAVLGYLQQLKQQSGSDLVYVHSLILGSLTPMVHQLKDKEDSTDYQASIRVDLLIDCIRHSSNPQVQNSSLLLIAALASWVPELVLHNLMPIFTFIGSTLLRQQDDYSAHVVDQTISRVVPQLAASLRAKHKDFLAGVADLLLSFTAAFEHIPQHRRLKLFFEVAQTLGPEDSLSAIAALLFNRYPTSTSPRKFVPGLFLLFEPAMTLQALKGYLILLADATSSRRKISETLFSLNEKQPAQVDSTVLHLLSSLADLAADKSVQKHISKGFRKSRDASKPRAIFAEIVESIIHLSKLVADKPRLYDCCSRVLANCLDLLPTPDLVKSAETLLVNPDEQVQTAAVKSVEVRAGSVTQNEHSSVEALLSFLPRIDMLLQQSQDMDVKATAVSCIDQVVEKFGKKDVLAVADVAKTVSGAHSLASEDDRVRTLSLLCLTSMVDVLEEDSISLLPTIMPACRDYLKNSIEDENSGLHNAVFALLSNVVERLPFMFSREYMIPVLELSQLSAASDLDEECDGDRRHFFQSLSRHVDAQEAFAAIKATWSSAVSHGFEALREQLDLTFSIVQYQPKSKIIRAASTLLGLLLKAFDIRSLLEQKSDNVIEKDELERLEASLIEVVMSMTLKLNDTTFRPLFVQLVDSVSSSSKRHMSHSITFYKFLAAFFDKFKSIVTTYSSYIIEHTEHLLKYVREQVDEAELRNAVLSAMENSFQHDQDGFWQSPSHYSTIMPPLLHLLTLPPATSAASTHAIPAIVELATASASSIDNHRDMNAILLRYMRAEEPHTRLATVLCEQALTKRLGEDWLALLPEMLPFIAELREDDDEAVERETQRWIGMVEECLGLGEGLDGMLE